MAERFGLELVACHLPTVSNRPRADGIPDVDPAAAYSRTRATALGGMTRMKGGAADAKADRGGRRRRGARRIRDSRCGGWGMPTGCARHLRHAERRGNEGRLHVRCDLWQ